MKDAVAGIERWNKIIDKSGVAFRLRAPHKAFNRKIGPLSAVRVDPEGIVTSEADWAQRHDAWLPSETDRAFVGSLMGRVAERGKFANWIAPPARGINNQPVDYEYVRFN